MSSSQKTPSQQDLMQMVEPQEVKVETASSMPVHARLAHVLAIVVATVIALCVSAVLADGTSVIKLKAVADLPVVTNPELKYAGIDHRLDELMGRTYGIGLHHDSSGHSWTVSGAGEPLKDILANLGVPAVAAALPYVISTDALKHPVPLLGCADLQMAGLCAMSFGFIAEVVAVVMFVFHALALADLLPIKVVKPFAGLVWLTLTAGFLIVICLAIGIYTATWECDQPVIPKITLNQHFDYNYGFAFAIIGFIASLLIFMTTVCFLPSDGVGAPAAQAPKKLGAGMITGLTLGAIIAIIVASANDGFDSSITVDENVNPCEGQKPYHAGPGDNYFSNQQCLKDNIVQTLEQAGGNVTKGFRGTFDAANRVPITKPYSEVGLCPVNVHWHLGAEHLSVGQYDEKGKGPYGGTGSYSGDSSSSDSSSSSSVADDSEYLGRRLGGAKGVRRGLQCHHYNQNDPVFTAEYDWKHCTGMHVGETYEVHWPHSAAGACGTKHQYQTPFYDGVFCKDGVIELAPLNTYKTIGVQAQVFTIVNSDDPAYYNGDLFKGMIVSGDKGTDMAYYTGSTTGTSRDNQICSRYTPITWQVDRKCHLISASSFDKMCQDMMKQADDMSGDVHAHGARALVWGNLTANNQQTRM